MKFIADENLNIEAFLKKMQAIFDSDKTYEIVIREVLKEYSDEQRKALWGLAYQLLSEETGNDPEDLHQYFCGEYFGWKVIKVMYANRKVPIRTTTRNEQGERDVISTADLASLFEFIQQRAAQTVGVYIPDPDPHWKKRMNEAAA
jgi:hypothetical protein